MFVTLDTSQSLMWPYLSSAAAGSLHQRFTAPLISASVLLKHFALRIMDLNIDHRKSGRKNPIRSPLAQLTRLMRYSHCRR
jgi:hypothetical protein